MHQQTSCSTSSSSQAQVVQHSLDINSVIKNIYERFSHRKNINFRQFLQELITFLSIISAYYFISLSYEEEISITQLTGIQFNGKKGQSAILLIFGVYLISLKIFRFFIEKYETRPPKKEIHQNYDETEETQSKSMTVVQETKEKVLPHNGYTVLFDELIIHSIYALIFILCTSTYTLLSPFNKKYQFVQNQQVNFIVFWFVTGCVFYSIGRIFGKMFNLNTLHHFGLAIGVIVLILQIGLSHGFNMLVFL